MSEEYCEVHDQPQSWCAGGYGGTGGEACPAMAGANQEFRAGHVTTRTCCDTPAGTAHTGTCPNSLMRSGQHRPLVNALLPPGQPWRGDEVEAWLRRKRDEFREHGDEIGRSVTDGLLDDYRLHADTGTPLDAEAREHG